MENIKNTLLEINQLKVNSIPDIDLYMDQVITILDNLMKDYKLNEDDKTITKTMINNYVKSKIIPKPTKKKYNKEHVMDLVMIYHLKTILNIKDVGGVIDMCKENMGGSTEDLYNTFLEVQSEVIEDIRLKISQVNNGTENDLALHLLKNLLYADLYKRVVEGILNGNKSNGESIDKNS